MRTAQERPTSAALGSGEDRTRTLHPLSLPGPRPSITQGRGAACPADVGTDRLVAGRYRLSSLLGTGGMGSVWLAEDAVLRRAVALKRLATRRPTARLRALREARAAASINHPGVVAVHDVAIDGAEEWIVMEALPGESLSTVLRDRGRLPVEEVRQIGLHLLSALAAIHAADLVHRDIKPGNVQICGDGRVVITDFGLSSPGGVCGGLRAGKLAGSLSYMAPETLVDGVFGPRSDLYALGVTLYLAIEGTPPFESAEPLALMDSVLFEPPEPATHAGPLRTVLEGLLEKDPARRLDVPRARSALQSAALVPTP
jgi:eukaryotic-like serine/threonine-protein kinase